MEANIKFSSEAIAIEGMLQKNSDIRGAVITHPHPLYGGNMHNNIDCLRLIVTGSHDDIAPPDLIRRSYSRWNAAARFEVINGADHFYAGHTNRLEAILASHLKGHC